MNCGYRRLCCLICSVVVMMACTALPASAGAPAGAAVEVEVLRNLEIIEDEIDAAQTVTRGEAVKLVLDTARIPSIPAAGIFDDVKAADAIAPYVETAYQMGLVSGFEDGTFQPEAPVTYAQLLKLWLSVCGYADYAEISGGYPAGYLLRAQSSKLSRGITGLGADTPATWAVAVKLAYNALHIDLMEPDSMGGGQISYQVSKGYNLLKKQYKIEVAAGLVTANRQTSIYDAAGAVDSGVAIDGKRYPSKERFDGWLGYQVDGYIDEDGSLLFLIPDDRNAAVSYMGDEVSRAAGGTIEVNTGDKKESYPVRAGASFFRNGIYLAGLDTQLVTADDLREPDTRYVLLDNNGDGEYDFMFAERYRYYQVKSVDLENRYVFDKISNDVIALQDGDGLRYLDGSAASLEDLKYNDVIGARLPDGVQLDGGKRVDVTFVIVDGIVSGRVNGESSGGVLLDGVRYGVNPSCGLTAESIQDKSGSFYLDAGGKLLVYEKNGAEQAMDYAYIVKIAAGSPLGGECQVKLLLPEEGLCVKQVSRTAVVARDGKTIQNDGRPVKGPDEIMAVKNQLVDRLVQVRLNSAGEISKITLARQLAELEQGEKNEFNVVPVKSYKKRGEILSDTYRLPKSAAAFTVPADGEDETVFRVSEVSGISMDEDFECELYSVSDFVAGAVLVRQEDASQAKVGVDTQLLVVESIGRAVGGDGEETVSVTGMFNGSKHSYVFRSLDAKARDWINVPTTVVPVRRDVRADQLMLGDVLQINATGDKIESFRVMYLRSVYNAQGEKIRGDDEFARQGSDDSEEIFNWAGLQWPFVSKAMLFVNGSIQHKDDSFFTIKIDDYYKNVFDSSLNHIYYVDDDKSKVSKLSFNDREFTDGKRAFVTFVWGAERDVVIYQ